MASINPSSSSTSSQQPIVVILEHPAPKALRFRYECEGRSAGSLPGANSTSERKSYPKIQIQNAPPSSRAVVVVSCVTVDPPYRPHPHNLVGKEGCKKGVCTMEISSPDMTCEFSNLGIQCVKKKDIEDSLKIRSEIRVDPFRTGFSHSTQPGSIDLNSLRLCFQVFLEGPERGQFKIPLKAAVSEPIYDKKAINDLTIMKLSDSSSPVVGGKEIIMLCDKVSKDDVEIRFYEESPTDGSIVWESFADFQPSDVHKQYAICFRTPQYKELEIQTPHRCFIQLRCPSKDTTSAPRPFDYVPLSSDADHIKRKRQKLMVESNNSRLKEWFSGSSNSGGVDQQQQQQHHHLQQQLISTGASAAQGTSSNSNPQVPPPPNFYDASSSNNNIRQQHQLQSPQQYHGGNFPNQSINYIQQQQNMSSPPQYQSPIGNLPFIKTEYNPMSPISSPQQQQQNTSPFHNPNYNNQHNIYTHHHNQGIGGSGGGPGAGGGGATVAVELLNKSTNYYGGEYFVNQGNDGISTNTNNNYSNISLPNLSDVNLSLLEEQLREGVEGVNIK